jgi:Na+-transporting methylmalonyl-CoA/oxaloacetate decarboxylase gamma subunit
VQVLRRGKGAGRVFVALLLLVLTALATADFATSRVAETVSSESQSETAAAITALKTVASAEKAIHSAPELPGHPANSYAGIDFLLKYRLVDKGFAGGVARNGYTFHLAAPADGQKFLVWAVPANYKGKKHDVREWIPGASLYGFFNPVNKAITEPGGVMSLSLDETGTLRGADLGGKADASAEEAAAWPEYKR